MDEYLIELPHTKAECMRAVGEISEKGSDLLPKVHWGCGSGVHNGWAIVEAENESAARSLIGSDLMRNKARVVKVAKYTKEDLLQYKKAHGM